MPTHVEVVLGRVAIAGVWLFRGLWCKVLGRMPRHARVVEATPLFGERGTKLFLVSLGWFEVALACWALSGVALREAALVQTALLVAMNTGGIVWARHIIPDPLGMLFSKFCIPDADLDMRMKPETAWNSTRRLLFGQMYEDAGIERRLFAPGSRVFCIASAGCMAIALSAEHMVTAVDLNPAQVE